MPGFCDSNFRLHPWSLESQVARRRKTSFGALAVRRPDVGMTSNDFSTFHLRFFEDSGNDPVGSEPEGDSRKETNRDGFFGVIPCIPFETNPMARSGSHLPPRDTTCRQLARPVLGGFSRDLLGRALVAAHDGRLHGCHHGRAFLFVGGVPLCLPVCWWF